MLRSACASRSASNARMTAHSTRSPSRACSPSTILTARARAARASATPSISISTSSSPTRRKTLNEGAIEPWTKPKYKPLAPRCGASPAPRHSARRALVRPRRRAAALITDQRRRKFPACAASSAPGAQEVQAARARFSQPLSRLFAVLGVQRPALRRKRAKSRSRARISARCAA
jgi:hypothetical protein